MSEQAKTVGVSDKMKAKDYITLGIFTVLFFAVVMVCIFASAATVVTFAFGSAIAAIPGGIIYMLMRAKVPKAGSVLLSGVVIGLIEFLIGAGWAVAVGFIAGAIIAELLTRIGHYKSFWLNTIGYSVYMMFFALGTYLPMVIMTGYVDDMSTSNGVSAEYLTELHSFMNGTMEPKAYLYAIPREYYEKYGVRRYGFHGTSHSFVSKETIKFADLDPKTAKVIVCHLGNGASISASIGGKCVDTSMGLTPLEGLIMGTRSGDLDPAIIEYLCNHENLTVSEMLNILNKKSGVLGMSGGISSDFRDLNAAANEGNEVAKVTLEAYAYRVAKYIGSYTAAMNGVDAITFTAGVGENAAWLRPMVCKYLGFLGVELDEAASEKACGVEGIISTPESKVKLCVIPTNEELAIARETLALVK